jgi:hypothetical protein
MLPPVPAGCWEPPVRRERAIPPMPLPAAGICRFRVDVTSGLVLRSAVWGVACAVIRGRTRRLPPTPTLRFEGTQAAGRLYRRRQHT